MRVSVCLWGFYVVSTASFQPPIPHPITKSLQPAPQKHRIRLLQATFSHMPSIYMGKLLPFRLIAFFSIRGKKRCIWRKCIRAGLDCLILNQLSLLIIIISYTRSKSVTPCGESVRQRQSTPFTARPPSIYPNFLSE